MCSWIQILILVLLSLLLNVVLVVLVILVIADSVAFAAATAAITFDVTVCVLVVLLNQTFPPLYVLYVVCKVPQAGLEKIYLGIWGITWNSLHIIIYLFLPQLSQVSFLLHWHPAIVIDLIDIFERIPLRGSWPSLWLTQFRLRTMYQWLCNVFVVVMYVVYFLFFSLFLMNFIVVFIFVTVVAPVCNLKMSLRMAQPYRLPT